MADKRMTVLATTLLAFLLLAELQRCSGQIHYKTPGWGPGGKRSPHMTGSDVFRKRFWHSSSQQTGEDDPQRTQFTVLQKIARSLAKKLTAPTLNGDLNTAREALTVNQ